MKEYEMTQEQLDKILDACKSNNGSQSLRERANNAWKSLSKEMSFDYRSVRPLSNQNEKGDRFFSAEPT